MTVRIRSRRRESTPPYTPYLASRSIDAPCPPILAHGIDGCSIKQAWLEDDGMADRAPAPVAGKPPYRIPLLSEIAAVPWNGLNAISTFSGCGGSTTGYKMSGYRVLAAVEFVPLAADSYELNHPTTKVLRADVRQVTGQGLLDLTGLKRGELDLFDGSPPCEPFSSAGTRDKHWRQVVEYSGQRQRTDDLFFEYARLIDELKPRAFVAENVEGLVRGRAKGYFIWILARLRALGYRVEARVLDASWLGVPQNRRRVIFVGIREDLAADPAFPKPLPYQYTVRDALPHIARIGTDPNFDKRRREGLTVDQMMVPSERPAPTVQGNPSGAVSAGASGANGYCEDDPEVVGFYHDTGGAKQGDQARQRNRLDEPAPSITNGGIGSGGGTNASHYQLEEAVIEQIVGNEAFEPQFGTLDQPSPTIMAGGARTSGELRDAVTLHRRTFTIPELVRICGFPDDYRLAGSFARQWERMGDSVAPPMAAAVSRELVPILTTTKTKRRAADARRQTTRKENP